MPAPMRRSAVSSRPKRRSSRIQHQVVERDQDHDQRRIQRLHHATDLNHSGLVIWSACSTQVEAFWSNSDQNGVTSANSDQGCAAPRARLRRPRPGAPRGARSELHPRARYRRSAITSTSAEAERDRRSRGWASAPATPRWPAPRRCPATTRPAAALAGRLRQQRRAHDLQERVRVAVATRRHVHVLYLRPAPEDRPWRGTSARPGCRRPRSRRSLSRKIGISSDAKNEPKLMIQ